MAKRKKVGAILTLTKADADSMVQYTVAGLDVMQFARLDARIRCYVREQGGELCGKIMHLREEYPSVTSNSKPNEGTMIDWRAWAIARFPDA